MTPNLVQFCKALIEINESYTPEYKPGNPPYVEFPARSKEVGSLVITDDESELTVCIGEIYHEHFSEHCYEGANLEDRLMKSAHDAAHFVAETMADRVRFSVRYKGGNCVGVSAEHLGEKTLPLSGLAYPLSAWWFRPVRKERFVWSGRIE